MDQAENIEDRFSARYRLGSTREHTGTAELRVAADATIGREVVLQRRTEDQGYARQRFLREARVQAQLEHPSVVPVYDIGLDPSGREFFTMRRVEGSTLRSVLDALAYRDPLTTRTFTRDRLLGLFRQVCLAVEFAHSYGVVHRDLRPDNVVLGDFGEVYVVGWAVVKLLPDRTAVGGVAQGTLTLGGMMAGTPGYAAPEQLLSASDVDARADVYALGVMLFELLTHERLLTATSRDELLVSMGRDTELSRRAQQKGVPRELEIACLRATAPVVSARLGSARELANLVDEWFERDRDADALALLALRHSERAEEAAVRALVSTHDGTEHRRTALREAGRALALNPQAEGARRALVALLREPPPVPPPEAAAAVMAEEERQARNFGRASAVVYGAFALLLLTVMFSGILRWGWFLLSVASLLVAMGASLWLGYSKRPRATILLVAFAASSFALASTCGMYGALILVPALAVANTLALNTNLLRGYRWVALLLGCATIGISYALERSGVLPTSYVFTVDSITVLPVVRRLPEMAIRIGLLASSLLAIIAPTVLVWRRSRNLDRLRERLYLNTWQLARLLPESARAEVFAPIVKPAPDPTRRRG